MPEYSAQIVLLSGSSSSGKSQLARALQKVLDPPFLRFDIDDFIAMFPVRYQVGGEQAAQGIDQTFTQPEGPPIRLGPFGRQFVTGFHQAAAAFAHEGNRLIVVHLLTDPAWLRECLELWKDLCVLFVGVQCDPEEVGLRERRRGDRRPGFAAGHSGLVHLGASYDLTVDTTRLESDDCARSIRERLLNGNPPSAFQCMRQALPNQRDVPGG